MLISSLLRQSRNLFLAPPYRTAICNMSSSVSYAAAISTPNGALRQPQIQSKQCSDPDLRSSFESETAKKPPQRPGAGIRSKTSFRGWTTKKGRENGNVQERGPIQEVQQNGYVTREEHRPNTGAEEEHVYVLTMKLEDSLSVPMNDLRRQYFPKRINRTPAHLTLFHALPHSHMDALDQGLYHLASGTKPFLVTTGGPFRMRKGVGVNVDAGYKELKQVHSQLQSQWMSFLSEQDQSGFRPHWTVMNKVDEEEVVEHALGAVRQELSQNTKEGRAIGLDLWKYERGNWIWTKEYNFGTKNAASTSPSSKNDSSGDKSSAEGPAKRPGMGKRGSSVAEAWRSMSFRRKS